MQKVKRGCALWEMPVGFVRTPEGQIEKSPDRQVQQAIEAVVRSAGRSLLLVSGGEHAGEEAMLEKARESMDAGATGLIFGRNVFQRGHDESLRFVAQLKEILAKYPS